MPETGSRNMEKRTPLRFELRLRRQKWKRVRRNIALLAAATSLVLLTALFVPEIQKFRRLAAEAGKQSEILETQEILRKNLQRERVLLDDPEYLEMIAREKIGVMKEGEQILK